MALSFFFQGAAYSPDTADAVPSSGFEDDDVEAMTNTMRRCSNACNTGADDSDLWPVKLTIRRGRIRCDGLGDDPLEKLIEEEERVQEGVLDLNI